MKKIILLLAVGIALTTQTLFAQVPSYVPTTGLVGYWPFNGNANDESGNGNNGIGTNVNYSQDRFNVDNKSLQVTGNGYVSISNSSNLQSSNNLMTVTGWFKPTTFFNNQWYSIICKSNSFSPMQFSIQAGPTAINFLNNGVAYQFLTTINLNTWYFFAIVQNQNTVNFYINNLTYTATSPGTYTYTYSTNNNMEIGRDIFGATEYSNGKIDDIGIWNRALTPQEITNLYNSANTNECLTMVINTGALSTNPVTYTSTVNIFPNPANDQITIDCGNLANVIGWNIKITNMLGQEVFNQPMNTQQYVVPLNSWTGQGMYFVKIINAQNEVVNIKKIILQ
jgi:hypothetical protein